MSKLEKDRKETDVPTSGEAELTPDMIRRDFIKRFGAYSVGTCAGVFLLMSPRTSKATGSDGGG